MSEPEYVTTSRFGEVLELLKELRDTRAATAKAELSAVVERLDRIDASQKEFTRRQIEANGRTATNEAAIKLLGHTVASIPCLSAAAPASLPDSCPAPVPLVEVSAAGVRWRPTKRQVAYVGTAIGGLLSWPAAAKIAEFVWQLIVSHPK